MSIKYIFNNNEVNIVNFNESSAFDTLKPAVYQVCFHEMKGFYLTYMQDTFKVPAKLYGSTSRKVAKVVETYNQRSAQTGVLLTGAKGTGKTILTEALCNKLNEQGLPTLVINEPFIGSDFFRFMKDIGECVVLFDEFGKVYTNANKTQQALLPFLDGAYSSRRLLLFTENSDYLINEFMLNRPGRVFYHFKYTRVEDEVIQQYAEDAKLPADIISELINEANSVLEFSFDMLKHVVEEYLRYNAPIKETLVDMNISNPKQVTIATVTHFKHPEYPKATTSPTLHINHENFHLEFQEDKQDKQADSDELRYDGDNNVYIRESDIVSQKGNIYVYLTPEGVELAIRKEPLAFDATKYLA